MCILKSVFEFVSGVTHVYAWLLAQYSSDLTWFLSVYSLRKTHTHTIFVHSNRHRNGFSWTTGNSTLYTSLSQTVCIFCDIKSTRKTHSESLIKRQLTLWLIHRHIQSRHSHIYCCTMYRYILIIHVYMDVLCVALLYILDMFFFLQKKHTQRLRQPLP